MTKTHPNPRSKNDAIEKTYLHRISPHSVGFELFGCGVALGRAKATELGRNVVGADSRCVQQRRAAHQSHDGAARRDRGTAAVRVEPRVGDTAGRIILIQGERDAD